MNEKKDTCYECCHSDEWDSFGIGMCFLGRHKAMVRENMKACEHFNEYLKD